MKVLEIQEWNSTEPFPLTDLSDADIAVLRKWSSQTRFFDLIFDHHSLSLKANGRIGQCMMPLPHYGPVLLYIHTKVPVVRLLEWWCWSEGLIQTSSHLVPLETLDDIIEQLACWLAQRVLEQAHRGLLSAYQRRTALLSSPKGRLLMRPSALALARGQTQLICRYEERSQDIPENQVLYWTLASLRRHGLKHPQASQLVQAAYRILEGSLSLKAFSARDCASFSYNRLNRHYEPMHRLSAMILSQISIGQYQGTQYAPSFILSMNQVFEGAVAKGLSSVLGPDAQVVAQEAHLFSVDPPVRTLMDLVIRSRETQKAALVLDTKYKQGNIPSNTDIYQVVSYASALNVPAAYLLYPHALEKPLACWFGDIACKSLSVNMDQPIFEALSPLVEEIRAHFYFMQSF
jgi:5-methylcytosine-specific restriction endonuclease McrBC regulatory subunit McrC